MSDDTYEGWSNRETWAVALHVNNDQGWQESVLESLREADLTLGRVVEHVRAGEIIRENVEALWDSIFDYPTQPVPAGLLMVLREIGSLWRVDWTELGAAFLEALAEYDAIEAEQREPESDGQS